MSYFKRAASQKPSKPLIVISGHTLTYGEQWSRCKSLQQWFEQQAVKPGVPVLLAVENELEQASLLLGLILIGHPPLILDAGATANEAKVILENSDFDAIISEQGTALRWQLSQYDLPSLDVKSQAKSKGMLGRLLKKKDASDPGTSWPAIVDNDPSPYEIDLNPEELAYIVFTSGTTSAPKGVEITRNALAAQMEVLNRQYGLDEKCQLMNTLPLHHVDGLLQGPLLAWTAGCTLHRPMAFTTQALQSYMDSIYRYRITHFIAVPTILALMHRLGQEWKDNFQSEEFQFIVSSAGHLDHHLWEQLEADFQVRVVNMYGLSETGTTALFSGPGDDSHLIGSIGKPVNSEIRIISDEGTEVESGEQGELLIASNQLMRGYYNNPEATLETLKEGWLYTGDLAKKLDAGHIQIVGRKKNQIISGGRNISPEEISTCLNTHTQVVESVVFGDSNKEWEEEVIALVVLADHESDEADLTEWCRTQLSEYKVPKHIIEVTALEKGPSGKIRIDAARRLYEHTISHQHDTAADDSHLESRIISIAAQVFRLHRDDLSIDSDIANTPGWDSLAHMSLVVEAEKTFSIKLSPREIMQVDSLARLTDICSTKLH